MLFFYLFIPFACAIQSSRVAYRRACRRHARRGVGVSRALRSGPLAPGSVSLPAPGRFRRCGLGVQGGPSHFVLARFLCYPGSSWSHINSRLRGSNSEKKPPAIIIVSMPSPVVLSRPRTPCSVRGVQACAAPGHPDESWDQDQHASSRTEWLTAGGRGAQRRLLAPRPPGREVGA